LCLGGDSFDHKGTETEKLFITLWDFIFTLSIDFNESSTRIILFLQSWIPTLMKALRANRCRHYTTVPLTLCATTMAIKQANRRQQYTNFYLQAIEQ
jgi:hypothetical protein